MSELASPEHPFECPTCPDFDFKDLAALRLGDLDLFSCLVGVVIGLLLGPVLDLDNFVRHSWRIWIKTRLRHLGRERERRALVQACMTSAWVSRTEFEKVLANLAALQIQVR